eukprot:2329504-Pyramimonas_sp.AAC.1
MYQLGLQLYDIVGSQASRDETTLTIDPGVFADSGYGAVESTADNRVRGVAQGDGASVLTRPNYTMGTFGGVTFGQINLVGPNELWMDLSRGQNMQV